MSQRPQLPSQPLPPHALRDVKVLVVDDEDILAWSIETELRALGAEVMRAGTVREALERFSVFAPDLAITDLRLPDGNGLELLKKWRFEHPELPVILITAHGAVDSAITALRLGAFDYLPKPFDLKDLVAAVRRASEIATLRQKVSSLQGREVRRTEVEIIGESAVMVDLRQRLRRVARSKANTVLILGDSGTGKELAARAVHEWSDRRGQPFVEVNCASIPETLLESELFGFERGAFTDARERKLGLFEMARGGSIFLDEIGEMSFKLQAKLLRVLEYRHFKRLGGTKDIEFNGRIVAATNRHLLEEVRAKNFREDLYYRLHVLPIHLPPLAERRDDIEPLTRYCLRKLAQELELPEPLLAGSALERLKEHTWPGNVRELRNVLQRALVFHEPSVLEAGHLELDLLDPQAAPDAPRLCTDKEPRIVVGGVAALVSSSLPDRDLGDGDSRGQVEGEMTDLCGNQAAPDESKMTLAAEDPPFRLPAGGVSLEGLEKSLLEQALDRAHHNQTRAAQLLGISRHTLRYRLEKHGLMQSAGL